MNNPSLTVAKILTNADNYNLEQYLKDIALTVAVNHPEAFFDAFQKVVPDVNYELTKIYESEDRPKIPMIKKLRDLTGMQLREAKDYVEEHFDFAHGSCEEVAYF